jgi:hypothetical protein
MSEITQPYYINTQIQLSLTVFKNLYLEQKIIGIK